MVKRKNPFVLVYNDLNNFNYTVLAQLLINNNKAESFSLMNIISIEFNFLVTLNCIVDERAFPVNLLLTIHRNSYEYIFN